MLEHQNFRVPAKGEPMVLAPFSHRYNAHLVPGLLENIRPAVHGYLAWDDRTAGASLSDEPARRARLVARAWDFGAVWPLTPDPDERIEAGFAGCGARPAVPASMPGWAVVLAWRVVTLGVDVAAVHAAMARFHAAEGNPVAAALRNLTARRLKATQAVWSAKVG